MADVEVYSWWFVYKKWNELKKLPTIDKGFEESFREYLYGKISFDRTSDVKNMGLGLSYSTLSGNPHELDVICEKSEGLFVFELKHYEMSSITKEIVFTFLGKVMDFYFKNSEILSKYKIAMLLVTINRNVDDSIRKLCITYGIKLIEPSIMTIAVMDYFSRDLYQKIQNNSELKHRAEALVKNIGALNEQYNYSFSDIFRFKEGEFKIKLPLEIEPTEILNKIKAYYNEFKDVRKRWNP